MDIAEDAEIGSGTSFITRLAKNLSTLVDMAEGDEIGKSDDGDDETIENHLLKSQADL